MPKSIARIGGSAFSECTSLEGIALPEQLLAIESYAFVSSGLRTVTVPEHVEFIGDGAFDCESLTEVIMMPKDPPTLDNFVVQGYPYHLVFGGWTYPIYVPSDRVGYYMSGIEWDFYVDRIFPISERNH